MPSATIAFGTSSMPVLGARTVPSQPTCAVLHAEVRGCADLEMVQDKGTDRMVQGRNELTQEKSF